MKIKNLALWAGIFSAALSALSCNDAEVALDSGMVQFRIGTGSPGVKSSFTGEESAVNSVFAAAYRTSDGTLAASASAEGNTVSMQLAFGTEYEILLLCNTDFPDEAPPTLHRARETDIDVSREIVSEGIFPGGLPMAGDTVMTIPRTRSPFSLEVKRMVSRWDFRFVDTDGLGMKVDSIRIKGCPLDFQPWALDEDGNPCSKASMVADGDWSTAADLATVNSDLGEGGANSVPFYVLENMRGKLLPDGSRPWDKSADNPELQDADLCTYAEVSVSMDGGSGYYRMTSYEDKDHDLVYRCYLGEDMDSNFDIRRNRAYSLVMEGTRASVDMVIVTGEQSWRTESYLFNDKYAAQLSIFPAEAELRLRETLSLAALTGSNGPIAWSSSNPDVASVSQDGVVTAHAKGSVTITATQSAYGSYPEMSASASITVKLLEPKLMIYPTKPGDPETDLFPYVVTLDYDESRIFHAVCDSDAVPVWTIGGSWRSLIRFVGGDSYYSTTGNYARIKNIQTDEQSSGNKDVYVNVTVPASGDYAGETKILMIMVQ